MVPLAFKLSSRDLVQMMAERGIPLAHTTVLRWVQHYVPDFEKRWQAYAPPVGDSWHHEIFSRLDIELLALLVADHTVFLATVPADTLLRGTGDDLFDAR